MKLPRKHVPVLTKVLVIRRQLRETYGVRVTRRRGQSMTSCFEEWLNMLRSCMNHGDLQLDHDPALGLRKFNPETGEYMPRELSHKHLVYRAAPAHLEKTTGRKPGAEKTITSKGSDVWKMQKFRRLENPKPKKSWGSGWGSGRKLQSKNSFNDRPKR